MDAQRLQALQRQPLHVVALGFVRGECFTARANYVRLEVRDEAGRLRFEHDVGLTDHWILLDMRFAGAHLVAAIGDIAPCGLRIWDTARAVETLRFDGAWQDEGDMVLWADAHRPRALVRYRGGVVMLDAAAPGLERLVAFDETPDCVTYDPAHDRLAIGEGVHEVRLVFRDFEGSVLATCSLEDRDVEELLFTGDGRFLAVKQVGRPVVVREVDTLETRWESASDRALAASPCGRWLALEGALVDLHSLAATPLPPAGGALFDAQRGALVLADRERTWRVPLP